MDSLASVRFASQSARSARIVEHSGAIVGSDAGTVKPPCDVMDVGNVARCAKLREYAERSGNPCAAAEKAARTFHANANECPLEIAHGHLQLSPLEGHARLVQNHAEP